MIDFAFFCELWTELTDSPIIDLEKDLMYKWLKNFAETSHEKSISEL